MLWRTISQVYFKSNKIRCRLSPEYEIKQEVWLFNEEKSLKCENNTS